MWSRWSGAHFSQQSRRALVLEAFSSSLLCCRYSCIGPLGAFIPPSLVCTCTSTRCFLCVDEFCSISSTFMVGKISILPAYLASFLWEKTCFQNPNSGINYFVLFIIKKKMNNRIRLYGRTYRCGKLNIANKNFLGRCVARLFPLTWWFQGASLWSQQFKSFGVCRAGINQVSVVLYRCH